MRANGTNEPVIAGTAGTKEFGTGGSYCLGLVKSRILNSFNTSREI